MILFILYLVLFLGFSKVLFEGERVILCIFLVCVLVFLPPNTLDFIFGDNFIFWEYEISLVFIPMFSFLLSLWELSLELQLATFGVSHFGENLETIFFLLLKVNLYKLSLSGFVFLLVLSLLGLRYLKFFSVEFPLVIDVVRYFPINNGSKITFWSTLSVWTYSLSHIFPWNSLLYSKYCTFILIWIEIEFLWLETSKRMMGFLNFRCSFWLLPQLSYRYNAALLVQLLYKSQFLNLEFRH